MFELSILRKYLLPKKKQLSLTLVSCLSVGVISLVVWLALVFLSVIGGIEKTWEEKLTSLNAPLRIQPTKAYYSSYYYLIDSFCASSGNSPKSIAQKLSAPRSDPYDPEVDPELPFQFPQPIKNREGTLQDPVKTLFSLLSFKQQQYKDLVFQEYELSGAMLKLELVRKGAGLPKESSSFLTQASYLASFSEKNPYLKALLSSSENPSISSKGHGILVAKNFQESGVKIGDRGYLAYESLSAGALQEQRLNVYVKGFYDPGIFSVGNKCLLVPPHLTRLINSSHQSQFFEPTESNGIQIWIKNLKQVEKLKKEIEQELKKEGIQDYWKVISYKEYDFAKDLMQQFQSDRYLFTLLAIFILVVACSNIISLLVILVNDKKQEIAILQSMGASSRSIACIFGGCGALMGMMGSLLGMGAAFFTLYHLDSLVHFLSFLQGHEAFNAAFYGKSLPNHLSLSAVKIVLIATPLLSLLAGLVPAFKACRIKPSEILRG